MPDYDEQIKELEAEIKKTKYNKATQHHVGLIKAKIAQLKEKEVKRSSGGKKGDGYQVRKTGDGTVLLLGFPSAGKSTLLNTLTNSESEVGAYAFTTLTVIPGILDYNHAKIQVLDVPGIVKGAASGRGRGKEVLATMRSADLALIVLDANNPEHLPVIMKEVYDTGIRLNTEKPDVKIVKKSKDGISIGKTVKMPLDNKTITDILRSFRINNADVVIRSKISDDQLIDAIEANKVYMPAIIVINKADSVSEETLKKVMKKTKAILAISAQKKINTDELKELIFEKLDLIRIYMKEPGKAADLDVPYIMFRNCTIKNVCEKVHRDMLTKFKFARIWGKSAKFPGQKLMLGHKLIDGDVLEIHVR